jgi:hypothetical protein
MKRGRDGSVCPLSVITAVSRGELRGVTYKEALVCARAAPGAYNSLPNPMFTYFFSITGDDQYWHLAQTELLLLGLPPGTPLDESLKAHLTDTL